MCGESSESLTTVKISQAELDVCEDCSEMGTAVDTGSNAETETEYSTDSQPEPNTSSSSEHSKASMDTTELRPDYGEAIQEAREEADLSMKEVANSLNEKESHLREVEQENRQPTKELQKALEDFLDVELSMDGNFT